MEDSDDHYSRMELGMVENPSEQEYYKGDKVEKKESRHPSLRSWLLLLMAVSSVVVPFHVAANNETIKDYFRDDVVIAEKVGKFEKIKIRKTKFYPHAH